MRPYRKEKMGSSIRDIVSETITQRLQDPRISPMTTVTRVELSNDLLAASVYVSVMGSEADERKTFAGIQRAAGYIQRTVAHELRVRHCPRLDFMIDESAKIARETMTILDQNLRENPSLAETDEQPTSDQDDSVRPDDGDRVNTFDDTDEEVGG